MSILELAGTEDTPQIVLDNRKGIMQISGRSLPEDAAQFFKPVLDWIQQYASAPGPDPVFVFKLEYFNTASSKLILDILYAIEGIPGMRVHWYFRDEDEDMEEAGQEFSELVNIPFEFKLY